MMSELRWALLFLGGLFVAALAVWERRRAHQARGTQPLSPRQEPERDGGVRARREPTLVLPTLSARAPGRAFVGEPVGEPVPLIELIERAGALPVLEPAPYAQASGDEAEPAEARREGAEGEVEPPAAAVGELLPQLPQPPAPRVSWPADRERRILAVRLVAPVRERFAGRSLRQALAAEGFVLGEFAIFHKPDAERRAVLSAASLTRPGTFDLDTMDSQHYGGLSLFAVLPGPKPPHQAFEELVYTARSLNERLNGMLQDEQGGPLTPARIAQLREELRAGAAS